MIIFFFTLLLKCIIVYKASIISVVFKVITIPNNFKHTISVLLCTK